MKHLTTLTSIFLCFVLVGCTYKTNVSYGTPLPDEKVAQIEKNKTTTSDLLALLGQPAMKSVLNENEEKWVYSHTGGKASAQSFTMKTETDLQTHTLDILIRDGVVINFTENKYNPEMHSTTTLE